MKPLDILESITGYSSAVLQSAGAVKLARIDPDYDANSYPADLPRVTFDGESTLSVKFYPVMGSYAPYPGDRVVMIPVGHSYVIIGSLNYKGGFRELETVQWENTGSLNWSNYPNAYAAMWKGVGSGGAGGGVGSTSSGEFAAGAGGGGGAYGEKWLLRDETGPTVTVTVGNGGSGGTGTGGSGGNAVISSSAGTHMTLGGGSGGASMSGGTNTTSAAGGSGGSATGADFSISGGDGEPGTRYSGTAVRIPGVGGHSQWGRGAAERPVGSGSGLAGSLYGGGGSGARATSTGTQSGGAGAKGLVRAVLFVR